MSHLSNNNIIQCHEPFHFYKYLNETVISPPKQLIYSKNLYLEILINIDQSTGKTRMILNCGDDIFIHRYHLNNNNDNNYFLIERVQSYS